MAEGAMPVACGLGSFDDVSRGEHRRLASELLAAMTGAEELPNGYALRFPAKPFLFLRIARWIELERACCPFLTIRMEIERSTPAYRLELTGPEGTKDVLEKELLRIPMEARG